MAESSDLSDFNESGSELGSESTRDQVRVVNEIYNNMVRTIENALNTLNSNNEQVKRKFLKKVRKLQKMSSKVQRFEQHSEFYFESTLHRAQKIMAAVAELENYVEMCYAHKTLDLEEYTLEDDYNYAIRKRQRTDEQTKENTGSNGTPKKLKKCRATVVDMEFLLSKLILEVNENNISNAAVVTILASRIETMKEDINDHMNNLSLLLSQDNDEVEDVQEKTGLLHSVVTELVSFDQSCLQVHFEMSLNENGEVELLKKSLQPEEKQEFKGQSNLFAKDLPLSAFIQRK